MGELIDLESRRLRRHPRRARVRGTLYVDLADPLSVIALDDADRGWPEVRVRLACGEAMGLLPVAGAEEAHRRAATLRTRLELPEAFPYRMEAAVRVGSRAIGAGRGREFVLAAARLAYHGGYDLRSPEVLAEAAGSAGLSWEATLTAMHDPRWSAPVRRTSWLLRAAGAPQLPVLATGERLVCGDDALRLGLAQRRSTAG